LPDAAQADDFLVGALGEGENFPKAFHQAVREKPFKWKITLK